MDPTENKIISKFIDSLMQKSYLVWPLPVVVYSLYEYQLVANSTLYTFGGVIHDTFLPFLIFLLVALSFLSLSLFKYSHTISEKVLLVTVILITATVFAASAFMYLNTLK